MRKSKNLYRLALINYKGQFAEVSKVRNIHNWTFADLESGDVSEYITKRGLSRDSIVYLSPDGEEELKEFDTQKTYIIGGLVDPTVNVNQTKMKARDCGIKAMRLPLDEFRKVNHFRPCLNINTVFEIIDNYLTCHDISKSILDSLPERFREEYLARDRNKPNKIKASTMIDPSMGNRTEQSDLI